jgi:signal transduction histidine kinase
MTRTRAGLIAAIIHAIFVTLVYCSAFFASRNPAYADASFVLGFWLIFIDPLILLAIILLVIFPGLSRFFHSDYLLFVLFGSLQWYLIGWCIYFLIMRQKKETSYTHSGDTLPNS